MPEGGHIMHPAHLHWLSEHRTMAAVLQALRHLSQRLAAPCRADDLRVLRAMLLYLSDYPERVHHAQEEAALFPRLQGRNGGLDQTIDKLHRQHGHTLTVVHRLEHLLNRAEFGQSTDVTLFKYEAEKFVASYLEHMQVEEQTVLPQAEAFLDDAQWDAIWQLLADARDPLHALPPAAEFETLFSTIVQLTPAPLGLGDAR